MRTFLFRSALGAAVLCAATQASAGVISIENAKPGASGDWVVLDDGTAAADGVVDVYPAEWSIAQLDSIHLKVRSTTTYDVRIFRLGYYGGTGATEVKVLTGNAADPQPYPTADATYGMAEAKWHTSVTIPTDTTWTPGVYAARIEQSGGGKQAETIFVIRDDKLAAKLPILFVLATNTHQAYNAWPGPLRGGKSLYGFNCSSASVSEDVIAPPVQAVKVSFDRPFFVGGGTADISRYEYPFFRWLERQGKWDVAYATDLDLEQHPGIMTGRSAVVFVGHSEYWSRPAFDNALAARDAKVNMLFATGDTVSWQVRFESGAAGSYSTMVGYKENYPHDPEQKAALAAPDATAAAPHYALVTRGWKSLNDPRPGMKLTGVASYGQIRDAYGVGKPDYNVDSKGATAIGWADLVVNDPTFWLFAGTGMVGGDRIKNVMGYEVDSTAIGDGFYDAFRPGGCSDPAKPLCQRRLGTIYEVSDGKAKGATGYYMASSGAEVIGMGAIAWSWALDDYASKAVGGGTVDAHAQQMMTNVFDRWTALTPPPPPPPPPDGGIDVGPDPDASPPDEGFPDTGSGVPDIGPIVDTGVADSSMPDAGGDTTAPDTAVADSPADSLVDSTTDASADSQVDGTTQDTNVADGAVDSTTGSDGSVQDSGTNDDAGPPQVSDTGSSCGCTIPGQDNADSGAIALAIGGLAYAVAARRRRKAR